MKKEKIADEMSLEEKEAVTTFDFSGGNLCLDFANTLTDRSRPVPIEELHTYTDFIDWCKQSTVLSEDKARPLLILAQALPAEATNWLKRARQMREAIYQLCSASISGLTSASQDLACFNREFAAAMSHACLLPTETGFTWSWNDGTESLDQPLWFIVHAAAELFTSSELGLVRICASEGCNWLFMDTSKNHSRRWCNMQTCGNRAKVQRHYDRKKARIG